MVFDKAKVLKAAEKFLSQGKISSAIKEYRQIVENDADDLTTLNMLGDLCVRAGKNDEAISCFSRIAEHYREQEFTLKAIAMYKKIERLKPRDPAIAHKLAALYATQGLPADARAQYLIVADALTRAGKTTETLEILHKVADLDPKNTEIRLKLAEGYLKEGLEPQAGKAFLEAATRLFDTSNFEQALNGYSKALGLRPNDENCLRGVVKTHIALGSADEAAELLEQMVAERSGDSELVSMLARTYIEAEDPRGAERATTTLVGLDASSYARFVEVARLYLKSGEVDEASRILAGIIEQLLAGREETQLLELVNEALARNPEHVATLRLLVRIHWWQRDMESLRLALERLAESAAAAGLDDDERYALTQLVRLSPDEQRYTERLGELGGIQEDTVEDVSFSRDSSFAEVPSFESFGIVTETVMPPGADTVDSPQPTEQFEWNSVVEPQATADPSASFADLNEPSGAETSFAQDLQPDESTTSVFEFGSPATETSGATESERSEERGARTEAMLRQELESVDFYITQGYVDIAADTLDLMERQFGFHPEIASRREKLKGLPAGGASIDVAPAVFEFSDTEQSSDAKTAAGAGEEFTFAPIEAGSSTAQPSLPKGDGQGIDAGLAEIFEEFKMAAEEEPSTNEDYETHYNMGTAYKEMDLLDEAIQEFQIAANLCKPSDGTARYLQCCNMLGHCFTAKGMPRAAVLWFKKGLEAPGAGDDEYKALRYELGLAYEQMGDLNRAFDLFSEVYGVDISYRGVGDKLRELETQKEVKKRDKKRGRKSVNSKS
ncbi:MAG: tetratricopeptide repeat protein [Pyrinomonadaceae bacterium]